MLHVGIANRGFERRFELADYVRVENADLADGLLVIDLVREVPEAMKPKKIACRASASSTWSRMTARTMRTRPTPPDLQSSHNIAKKCGGGTGIGSAPSTPERRFTPGTGRPGRRRRPIPIGEPK